MLLNLLDPVANSLRLSIEVFSNFVILPVVGAVLAARQNKLLSLTHQPLFAKDEEGQDKAVLIIKQGLVDHSFVADPEINLASVMIKLARLDNGQ